MRYSNIREGRFVSRPNRFIAMVEVDGIIEKCHVKNTGRCREILVPGTKVVLQGSDSETRKTRYDLIAAYKGDMLINIDSQAPNVVFGEYLRSSQMFSDEAVVRPEYTHGDSRFDFYVEDGTRKVLIEVKGVTLEFDGVCMFPDAPTERGVKHLRGLAHAIDEGYESMVCLIVQMKGMDHFIPNYATHREFGEVLEDACSRGVVLKVLECHV
ncbi:MAG: DNA/RNA nuclease SfsA [Candidatus Methanomethylophilaceae archaeon]|nr:DNA/RNA nuclease SfsA [Candidatus Methanomethylophilaceae archaeon]